MNRTAIRVAATLVIAISMSLPVLAQTDRTYQQVVEGRRTADAAFEAQVCATGGGTVYRSLVDAALGFIRLLEPVLSIQLESETADAGLNQRVEALEFAHQSALMGAVMTSVCFRQEGEWGVAMTWLGYGAPHAAVLSSHDFWLIRWLNEYYALLGLPGIR